MDSFFFLQQCKTQATYGFYEFVCVRVQRVVLNKFKRAESGGCYPSKKKVAIVKTRRDKCIDR